MCARIKPLPYRVIITVALEPQHNLHEPTTFALCIDVESIAGSHADSLKPVRLLDNADK